MVKALTGGILASRKRLPAAAPSREALAKEKGGDLSITALRLVLPAEAGSHDPNSFRLKPEATTASFELKPGAAIESRPESRAPNPDGEAVTRSRRA
jgi:hypothetical protein